MSGGNFEERMQQLRGSMHGAEGRILQTIVVRAILYQTPRSPLQKAKTRTAHGLALGGEPLSSVANNINNTYIGNMNLSKYYCIVKW